MEIEVAAAEAEERVVTTARQILNSLGSSESMTRDMLTILSTFDIHVSFFSHQNLRNPSAKSADFEANLASADRIISFWDSNSSNLTLFQSNPKEANQYLAAVDGLRNLMENLAVTHRTPTKLVHAQRLMKMSMARLEKEFHRILSTNGEPTMAPDDGDSSHGSSDDWSLDEDSSRGDRSRGRNSNTDEICEIDMMPIDAVLDLRSIAKRMVAGGYGKDYIRIYGQTRNSVIEGCLIRIGVDRLSKSDVQKMQWEVLEIKIKNWIRAVRIAVRILFASEKRLCDEIFAGLNNVSDSCFAEVVKGPTAKLLAFADSVAMSKKSSQSLFRVLDMYESLSDLLPDIDTVYCQESCSSVRTQVSTTLVRLGESVWGILTEFENAIQAENSKTRVTGGTIHPLTKYAMNYLSSLSDYKEVLIKITASAPCTDLPKVLPIGLMGLSGELDAHDDYKLGSPAYVLSMKLRWIIIILQCKLDSKTDLYKDVALSYLFLMNNLHYVVKKVKGSKLLGLLGYGWLRKNQSKVKQYAANYERAAWMKSLNCLSGEGIPVSGGFSSGVSRQVLKDKFRGFNCAIDEALRNNSGWIVPDVQLQEELRISIAEKIIPAYRSFLGRHRKYLESERHSEMYIKYTPEELEIHFLDLFQGNPESFSSRDRGVY